MRTLAAGLLAVACLPLWAQDARTKEEALKRLTADLPRFVQETDTDRTGTIKRAEFAAFETALRKATDATVNELDPSIAKKKAAKDLKKYDTSGDGRLDENETKAMEEQRRLKAIKDFDWDQDGKLNERETTAMQWAEEGRLDALFRRLDRNGKGELSKELLASALGDISRLKKSKK